MLAVNLVVLVVHVRHHDWRIADGSAMAAFADLTLVNVAVAVVVRQQAVLNVLYGLAGRGSPAWPLWIRWSISKVHHVGGIHAGSAIAGTGWMWAFAGAAAVTRLRHPGLVSPTTLGLAVAIAVVLAVVTACAAPPVRARAHDVFEQTHRWGGWTALALFWALTIELAIDGRGDATLIDALATDWHVWVLAVLTACIVWPWLRLRRVPITVHRPSSHVAVVELDYGVRPAYSSGVGISRTPLGGWHAFATIATPGRPGTGWSSPVPVTGPALHRRPAEPRVGARHAGVGADGEDRQPLLAGGVRRDRQRHRTDPRAGAGQPGPVPAWCGRRRSRRTYGDALVDEVAAIQPDAVIWDTTRQGKPDLLGWPSTPAPTSAPRRDRVSNKATTLRLVEDLERRGSRPSARSGIPERSVSPHKSPGTCAVTQSGGLAAFRTGSRPAGWCLRSGRSSRSTRRRRRGRPPRCA